MKRTQLIKHIIFTRYNVYSNVQIHFPACIYYILQDGYFPNRFITKQSGYTI